VHGSWTDELPHDLEPLTGAGLTLGGRLSDGRRVAARMIPLASPEEGPPLVARLRRLAGLTDPHLVPTWGAAAEGDAIWALSEPEAGDSVRTLRAAGPLSPALAVSVAVGALAGLSALHRAGLAHGSLDEDAVRVTADGRVRLADCAIEQGDPGRDLAAVGTLLCEALDVPERPDDALREAERAVPALVATARALAAGRYASADAALGAVRSAAVRLARAAVGDRTVAPPPPPPAPAPPPAPVERAAVPAAARARRPARSPVLLAALLLAAIGLGGLGVGVGVATAHRAAPSGTARLAPPAPTATPTLTPVPTATPATPTPEATPPAATAPPAPAPAPAPDTPDAAVARFYQLIQDHQFDAALGLWSPRMRAAYPPGENLYQRFADTTSIQPVSDRVSVPGDSTAVVAVDVVEVRSGRTYRWTGSWYLVRGPGWLLDQPALRQA